MICEYVELGMFESKGYIENIILLISLPIFIIGVFFVLSCYNITGSLVAEHVPYRL